MNIYQTYKARTPGSKKLHERGRGLFPGGVSHNLRLFAPYPVYAARGEGGLLVDVDGNEYVDLWMGHYSLILGHGRAEVRERVGQVLETGWQWGAPCCGQLDLAAKISEAIPTMEMVRFCTTGTEATMYAVRLARGVTGKPVVLKVSGGWHGASTDLSFARKPQTGGPEGKGLLPRESQGIDLIRFNEGEETLRVVEQHRGEIAAIIVEPMIGAAGFLPAKREYLQLLRTVCDEEGAALIFDEIVTGFRLRYGSLADRYGVRPDLTTLGKIVGGGFPIGVYGGSREIMSHADPATPPTGQPVLVGGGTFSANPVSMAAGLATLETLEAGGEELYANLSTSTARLRESVESCFTEAGLEAVCTGDGSLFMTHLMRGERSPVETPADVQTKTFAGFGDEALRIALLNAGVYPMHGGGALSTGHTAQDLAFIERGFCEAARVVAPLVKEMKRR